MQRKTINPSPLLLFALLMLGMLVGCKKDNVAPSKPIHGANLGCSSHNK